MLLRTVHIPGHFSVLQNSIQNTVFFCTKIKVLAVINSFIIIYIDIENNLVTINLHRFACIDLIALSFAIITVKSAYFRCGQVLIPPEAKLMARALSSPSVQKTRRRTVLFIATSITRTTPESNQIRLLNDSISIIHFGGFINRKVFSNRGWDL